MKKSLFIAGLFALSLSHHAFAADPVAFYPSQGWSVSNSCAVSSVYNNGYGVTLDGQDNLQIDFKQSVFENGKSYPVTFSLPGQEGLNIEATAKSDAVLNFDISPYKGLAKAMVAAKSFDTVIEGNAFRFFTTGLSQKAADIYSCANPVPVIQSSPAPVVAKAAPLATVSKAPAPVVQPTQEYTAIIQTMQRQIENLRSENLALKKAEAVAVKTPMTPIASPPVDNEAIQALSLNVERLKKENADLRKAAQAESSLAPVDDMELALLRQEIKDLREENLSLATSEFTSSSLDTPDWNLEKATMRFQEAERQLKDMGKKLQRERSKCQLEQRELEALLFDPQIADERQIAELAKLEDALADAEEKLIDQRIRFEERIKALEAMR